MVHPRIGDSGLEKRAVLGHNLPSLKDLALPTEPWESSMAPRKPRKKAAREGAGHPPAGSAGTTRPNPVEAAPPGRSRPAPPGAADRGIQLAGSALLLLAVGATFLPAPLAWGAGHWAYAPVSVAALLAAAGLVTLWTPVGLRVGEGVVSAGRTLVLGPPLLAYAALPGIFAALGWALRSRVHFLGDGWLLGELVSRELGYHGFDFVDYLVKARLFGALGLASEADSFALFAAISVAAGAFYAMATAFVARRFEGDAGERISLYLLLMGLPAVQLFFGYVECYALLSVGMVLFLGTTWLHYQARVPAWVPAAAFGFGLFWHLDALFLGPLLLFLIAYPPAGAPPVVRRLLQVAGPPLAALLLAAGLYTLTGYRAEHFELDFLTGREGLRLFNRLAGSHGMLSWAHWRDVVNLLLFLGALPLTLAAGGWIAARTRSRGAGSGGAAAAPGGSPAAEADRRAWVVFGTGSLWFALLAAALHMKLGIPRDWDLLAAQSPVLLLAALALWRRRAGSWGRPRVVAACAVLSLVWTAPWIGINAQSETAVARFRDLLEGQRRFARAYGHEEIGKYYRKLGEMERAFAEYERCTRIFPENARFHSVLGALQFQEGLKDASFESFRQCLEVDSTYATALEMMARLHAERSEFGAGIEYSRRLAGRPDESVVAASVHAFLAEQVGENHEAIEAYQRALRREPGNTRMILALARLYLLETMFPNAIGAYREILEREPKSVEARSGLLAALWAPLRSRPGEWSKPENRARIEEAHRLMMDLALEGQLTAGLQSWREELERAFEQTRPQR